LLALLLLSKHSRFYSLFSFVLCKAGWDAKAWVAWQNGGAKLGAQQAIRSYMQGGTMSMSGEFGCK
jgi:hypothetical protein